MEGSAQVARQPGDDRWPDRRHAPLPSLRTEAGEGRFLREARYEREFRHRPASAATAERNASIHWISALTYMYVLATGLAFYSPHLYWIAIVLGGAPTSRFWHPVIGLVFLVTLVEMLRSWMGDMRITATDRAWGRAMKHYIENDDEDLPPSDRFNLGQKYFFWVMVWGGVGLLLSGADPVVSGADSVESAVPALRRGAAARVLRADHDRSVHHSRLHGHRHGARRIHLHHPRRSFARLGEDAPSALVRSRHRQMNRWQRRIERAAELAQRYPNAAEMLHFYRELAIFQSGPAHRTPGAARPGASQRHSGAEAGGARTHAGPSPLSVLYAGPGAAALRTASLTGQA